MSDIASQLSKLAELKEKGFISQEEFDSEKSKLFNNDKNNSPNETIGNIRYQKNFTPPGVKGWSWGAFGFHWIWAIFNKTWIGLLAAIPIFTPVIAIILGFKGREWAWKNKEWQSIEHFDRVQKAWSKWAVVLFAVFFIPMLLFFIFGYNPDRSDNSATTENSNNQTYEFETTANALAIAYDKNTVSADMKYKGKKYKVSGVISEISTDMTDSAVITMQGGVNEFLEPQFELIASQKSAASELSSGQEIVLVCEGAGDIAKTPMSDNCEFYIEKSSNLNAEPAIGTPTESSGVAPSPGDYAKAIQNNGMTEEYSLADHGKATIEPTEATEETYTEQLRQQVELARIQAETEAAYAEQQKQQANLARIQAETEAAKAKKMAIQAESEFLAEQSKLSQERQAQSKLAECSYSSSKPLRCASMSRQPTYCAWNFQACGNPVIEKTESKTSCNGKAKTDRENSQIIVMEGCRALFVPEQ